MRLSECRLGLWETQHEVDGQRGGWRKKEERLYVRVEQMVGGASEDENSGGEMEDLTISAPTRLRDTRMW